MSPTAYKNFDLLITRTGETYEARVVDSPAGNAKSMFSVPFSDFDLRGLSQAIEEARGGAEGGEAVWRFGQRLFDAVFDGQVRERFHMSREAALEGGHGLRVRLRLAEVPELAVWPWEYLYDPTLRRHLVLSDQTPVVRYADMPDTIRPLSTRPPLRILTVIASPKDQPPVDVEREWSNLQAALKDLEPADDVSLLRLDQPTPLALRQLLQREKVHILHFVGHGVFDPQTQDGALVFENAAGSSDRVSASNVGTLLHDHETLRLVVLNACHGAQGAKHGAFAGVAQGLVGQSIPAVVAMQFAISDRAAIAFSSAFYRALANGYPVDAAVGEGRIAIQLDHNEVEWGVPVVYLRASEAYLFDTGRAKPMSDQQDSGSGKVHVSVGGDVSGKINVAGDDLTVNEGDYIRVGDIERSTVAIGRGASAYSSQGDTINVFSDLRQALERTEMSRLDKEDAQEVLTRLEQQDRHDPDQARVSRDLDRLLDLAPQVVELLVNAVTNPGAAIGGALKLAIKTWREAREG